MVNKVTARSSISAITMYITVVKAMLIEKAKFVTAVEHKIIADLPDFVVESAVWLMP